MISDEAFSRLKLTNDNLELLLHTLQRHFHLRLVIYYRHYHSWYLSQYNEHYKPLPRRLFLQKWPGEGGKRIKTFRDYYHQSQKEIGVVDSSNSNSKPTKSFQSAAIKGNYQLAASRLKVHPVVYLKNQWSSPTLASAVQDVVVVDMHDGQGDDATVHFLQQAFSKKLAEDYQRHKQQQPNTLPNQKNPSLQLDYDILAVEAREQHLFPKHDTLERRRVALYAEHVLVKRNSTATAPQVCLEEAALHQFLNDSLQLLETVFGQQQQQQQQNRQERLQRDFQQAVDESKFCNLDTQELLHYASVQKMFRSLVVFTRRID